MPLKGRFSVTKTDAAGAADEIPAESEVEQRLLHEAFLVARQEQREAERKRTESTASTSSVGRFRVVTTNQSDGGGGEGQVPSSGGQSSATPVSSGKLYNIKKHVIDVIIHKHTAPVFLTVLQTPAARANGISRQRLC